MFFLFKTTNQRRDKTALTYLKEIRYDHRTISQRVC
jgi:hypothetical protein